MLSGVGRKYARTWAAVPDRPLALLVAGLLAAGLIGAGCGEEEELDVVEGEPVELGELSYNVQITRFLNPDDLEDRAYLRGRPQPPKRKGYLAVFMTVENEGDSAARLPTEITIRDTRDNVFRPVRSDSVFAMRLGATVPPDGEVPAPDTAAASGPISGAMVLFLVDQLVTENRPIELEIPGPSGEAGRVELDI